MAFATGQRVLIPAKVHSPGSDRVWVIVKADNIHVTEDKKITVLIDVGDVQKAFPRFRAGQVYEHPGTGMRYFIIDTKGGYTDSDGMMGDLLSDENLELILDVEE